MTYPTLAFVPLLVGLCATLGTATNRRLQFGLLCAVVLVLAAALAGRFQ